MTDTHPEENTVAHNMADLFEHAVDAVVPERVAVVEGDRRLTYPELDAEANRWAEVLATRGVGAGDHVGVHMRNGIDCIAVFLGVLKLRAVPISINFRYVGAELEYLYEYTDLVALVFQREFGAAVTDAVRSVPALGTTIVVDDDTPADDTPAGETPVPENVVDAREALAAANPARTGIERSADDHFMILTGGTTGSPKGVVWRQEDLWRSLAGGSDYYSGEPVEDEFVQSRGAAGGGELHYLMLLPLIHTSGIMPTFTALFSGGTVHFVPKFEAGEVWRTIAREGVNVVVIAGDAMARPLVDRLREEPIETPSLFMVSSGAAQFSPALKREFLDLMPNLTLMDAVGSSESGFGGLGTVTKDTLDAAVSTHGPRFTRSSSMALVDEFDELLPDDSTEIGWIVKSGYLPHGYYKDDSKTAATFREVAGVRRAFTGDRGRYDGEGNLILLGRGSQVINTGGEKVFAEEVEAALKGIDGIDDAVVVGVPDDRFGTRVAALVASEDGEEPDWDAVTARARELLAGYKVPVAFWHVDEIGRHPSAKIDLGWARRHVAENAPSHDRRAGVR